MRISQTSPLICTRPVRHIGIVSVAYWWAWRCSAPIAHEDHAQRACLAALSIRDAVHAFAGSVRERHGVQFDIRIGLNSGEVMIGRLSDNLSMDYTALGHDVGVAQRMESLE